MSAVLLASGPVIPTFGQTSGCVKRNGTFCWDWFTQNWGMFQHDLVQHIELTAIAVGIGFTIAFVLALAAHRAHWLVAPVSFVGSFLYAIPSLAFFEIMVAVTGINWLTVEIALVSYTLLILFTNTLAGLSGVSPDVLDAARGIGLRPQQILWRVELPLAVPSIVAGLRIAVVTVVSLATVAAYLINAGLGTPIFASVGSGFKTQLIAAGVLCVALALVADGLFALAQRLVTPWAASRRGGS